MSLTTTGVQPRRVDVISAATQTAPHAQRVRNPVWPILAPALASAGLLWLCFFPLAWGWLAWVSLVPFLALVRAQTTPRVRYLGAWVGGSVFFWTILLWMPVNPHMYAAWAMLSVYCSLYFPVALALIRLLDRRTALPLTVSVPLVWIALEFIRSFALTGFAWYYLGHTQHSFLSMIQIADLGGVYLISFLVAAVNAWVFDLLYQMPKLRDVFRWEEPPRRDDRPLSASAGLRRGLIYEASLICLAIVGTLIYGGWRLAQATFEQGPTVTLLQTNIPQNIRNDADKANAQAEALRNIAVQSGELCKKAIDYHPTTDLIIWPETSYPAYWLTSSPKLRVADIPPDYRKAEFETRWHLTNELIKMCRTNHLLGMNSSHLDDDVKERRHNSALFLTKAGEIGERYDKMHRVPFGEYVPLRWLPLMDKVAPYDFDYSIEAGTEFTRFTLDKQRFGVLICYEDTDPFLARRYVRKETDGPPVDFLVNMSNDGWFEGGSEHDEHLAISRFRAIECRRALVRAVNMGISGVIDGNGRVLAPEEIPPAGPIHFWMVQGGAGELPMADWHTFKKSTGVIRARVPLDSRASFYAQTGDWFAGSCSAIVAGIVGWCWLRRRPGPTPLAA